MRGFCKHKERKGKSDFGRFYLLLQYPVLCLPPGGPLYLCERIGRVEGFSGNKKQESSTLELGPAIWAHKKCFMSDICGK